MHIMYLQYYQAVHFNHEHDDNSSSLSQKPLSMCEQLDSSHLYVFNNLKKGLWANHAWEAAS